MRYSNNHAWAWVAAWLIICGAVAVGFAIRAWGEATGPVPVNRSEVAEGDREPGLWVGEGGGR